MTKAQQLTLWFAGCIILAAVIGFIPFYMNGFGLTTPDAGGLTCGAHTLATTGQFAADRTAGLGYNFNICWSKYTYPTVQIFNAMVMKMWPGSYWQVIPFDSILMLIVCAMMMMVLSWRMTRDVFTTGITGVLSAGAPMALRSLILTPQNLYGYAIVITLLVILNELIMQPKRWWWWLVVVLLVTLLGFTHTLSFGLTVVTLGLWFWLFYLPNWRYRAIGLGVGIIAGVLLYSNSQTNALIQGAIHLLFGGMSGYDHPVYDHPALWGYVATALAGFGIWCLKSLPRPTRWLLICWLIVPITFAHLSVFGIKLLPERFVAFSWMSITILAAIGLAQLSKLLRWPAWFVTVFTIIILSAQITHAVVYMKDDVDGWSDRFRPHADYIQALQALNQSSPDHGVLVGIMAVSNREITFAPMWYDGPIASYPWYNLNHKNIKSFTAESSLYKTIIADPTNPEYLRIQAFYTIITKPNSAEAKQAATTYNLEYLILPNDSQAGVIWQKAKPTQFTKAYENQTYTIYQLR